MIKIQVTDLNPKTNSTEVDMQTQNEICGGLKAANSITDYGTSTSSFNVTQFEAGDTGIIVNQINAGDEDVHLPYKATNKVLNFINQTGNGTVVTEGY